MVFTVTQITAIVPPSFRKITVQFYPDSIRILLQIFSWLSGMLDTATGYPTPPAAKCPGSHGHQTEYLASQTSPGGQTADAFAAQYPSSPNCRACWRGPTTFPGRASSHSVSTKRRRRRRGRRPHVSRDPPLYGAVNRTSRNFRPHSGRSCGNAKIWTRPGAPLPLHPAQSNSEGQTAMYPLRFFPTLSDCQSRYRHPARSASCAEGRGALSHVQACHLAPQLHLQGKARGGRPFFTQGGYLNRGQLRPESAKEFKGKKKRRNGLHALSPTQGPLENETRYRCYKVPPYKKGRWKSETKKRIQTFWVAV